MLTRSANASPNIHAFHYAPSHSSRQSPPSRNSAAPAPVRRPSSASSIATAAAIAQLSVSAGQLGSSPALSHAQPTPTSPLVAAGLSSSPADHPLSQPYPIAAPFPAPVQSSLPFPSSASRPSRYVAVDAATWCSPMVSSGDAATTSHTQQPTVLTKQPTPRELLPTHGPIPMAPGIEQGIDPASGKSANGYGAAQQHHSLQGRPSPGAPATAHSASALPASTSTHPPSSANPTPATASLTITSNPPSSTRDPASSSGAASASTLQNHSYASSPHKRRNSQSKEPYATTAAAAAEVPVADSATSTTDPSSATKRARPEVAPPKMLPEQYESCPVEDMVVLIANMLGELIETNDALALKSGHLTRFHSRTPPGISVLDYLYRLAKHATLIPPLLLSMVYYIDRLCAMYPDFTINTLTVHRFLITAATVAAKGLSDSFWNNTTYARVGGVKVNELKMLELEFLYRLDWRIVPNPEVLAAYYRPLVERCPGYALPPDSTTAASSRSPSDDGNEMDGASDSIGSDHTHRIRHHRQSSTSLIGEDMVVSGLARAIRQERG